MWNETCREREREKVPRAVKREEVVKQTMLSGSAAAVVPRTHAYTHIEVTTARDREGKNRPVSQERALVGKAALEKKKYGKGRVRKAAESLFSFLRENRSPHSVPLLFSPGRKDTESKRGKLKVRWRYCSRTYCVSVQISGQVSHQTNRVKERGASGWVTQKEVAEICCRFVLARFALL